MLEINGTNIRFVAGDTARIKFYLTNYDLATGDKVIFTARKKLGEAVSITALVTTFTNGKATIELTSILTDVDAGTYVYDIQVELANGDIDTVIIGQLTVVSGVTL